MIVSSFILLTVGLRTELEGPIPGHVGLHQQGHEVVHHSHVLPRIGRLEAQLRLLHLGKRPVDPLLLPFEMAHRLQILIELDLILFSKSILQRPGIRQDILQNALDLPHFLDLLSLMTCEKFLVEEPSRIVPGGNRLAKVIRRCLSCTHDADTAVRSEDVRRVMRFIAEVVGEQLIHRDGVLDVQRSDA